ncbi:MAG: hypothetical protein H0U00_09145 [Actinobacteria bacterium]|nr:hypothetical protein [Actinomycetota bacterium]
MAKLKRLKPSAWKTTYTPTFKDRHIEAAWLDEHWGYGGRIHEVAAEAITSALRKPSSRAEGHALYFKLFAEVGNALEVAGALGWVIRTRRDHPLLLDAFLTYPTSAPRDFYKAVRRNRSGSLIQLLKLPAEAKVVAALATSPDLEWTEDEARLTLTDGVRHARFLADRHLGDDEIIRSTYNRAKHGATMLHDASLPVQQFYVIAPHLEIRGARDKARYDMPKFTVNRGMVQGLEKSVAAAGAMIRYLSGLAKALNEAGLLYQVRRP